MKQSLFRTIRRKLLEEGKLLRYLTYALGEIVLIVVGILFALKINDWNEDRKAQAEFDLYIVQLKEDVKTAIDVAENRMSASERRRRQALTVVRLLEQPSLDEKELPEFETALGGLGKFAIRDLNFGHLGEILDGDLEAITQEKALANRALQMTQSVKSDYQRMMENFEMQRLCLATFARYRGLQDDQMYANAKGFANGQEKPVPLRYNLEELKGSDEFRNATQNMIYFLGIAYSSYHLIAIEFEAFLTFLKQYE